MSNIRTVAIVAAEIAVLKTELALLKAAGSSVALPADGSTISFNFGRGDSKAVKSGVVIGSVAGEGKGKPALVKVIVGSGFSAETVTIFPSQIVVAAAEAQPEAEVAAAE